MHNIRIPNNLFIPCQSSNTLTSSNNCIALLSARGLNKCHRRERTSEGLTNNIKRVRDPRSKWLQCQLNSESNYIKFDWVECMSKDYFQVLDAINDCYKKMLEIDKCNKVFRPDHGGLPDILPPSQGLIFLWQRKTYFCDTIDMLKLVHQDLLYIYWCWNQTGSKKYANSKKLMPSQREILVKEQILEHEFITNNLNIVKCNVCLEWHIQNNNLPDQESYTCKKML